MSKANALEQSMLDLINAERAAVGVAPLVFNDLLNDASEDHSSWMLDEDQFSHTGEDGSSPHERIKDAGYKFEGNYRSGENIAFQSERGAEGLEDDVVSLHEGLMDSPGHRANILNPDYKEIGIGIERGDFSDGGSEYDAVMATQNFATSDADNSSTMTEEPTADTDDTPTTDDPATEEPVDVTEDGGDDATPDTPATDETPDTETPTDVTNDEETDEPGTPVGDDVTDEEEPVEVTEDTGDDTVEDTPTTDEGDTNEDTVEDGADDGETDADDADMPDGGFEYDGDLYFVNIGELNFDFDCANDADPAVVTDTDGDDAEDGSTTDDTVEDGTADDDMDTDVVTDAEDDADTVDAGDTADTAEDPETADDTVNGDFDMAMFVEQLTDLLEDFFGDVCSCSEMA